MALATGTAEGRRERVVPSVVSTLRFAVMLVGAGLVWLAAAWLAPASAQALTPAAHAPAAAPANSGGTENTDAASAQDGSGGAKSKETGSGTTKPSEEQSTKASGSATKDTGQQDQTGKAAATPDAKPKGTEQRPDEGQVETAAGRPADPGARTAQTAGATNDCGGQGGGTCSAQPASLTRPQGGEHVASAEQTCQASGSCAANRPRPDEAPATATRTGSDRHDALVPDPEPAAPAAPARPASVQTTAPGATGTGGTDLSATQADGASRSPLARQPSPADSAQALIEPARSPFAARGPPAPSGSATAPDQAELPAAAVQKVKLLAQEGPPLPEPPPGKPAPGQPAPVQADPAKYVIGAPTKPALKFDDDFMYDPNAKATFGDYVDWNKWGAMQRGAQVLRPDLDDATELYAHYRDGTGTPKTVDYGEAYREDPSIRRAVDGEIASAREWAERIHRETGNTNFSMTGRAVNVSDYPETENWQKALGGHKIWGSGDVKIEGNRATMTITIHAEDRYNFNAGSEDIATGAPDNDNGRFAQLGWAKPFDTNGQVTKTISWDLGSSAPPQVTEPESPTRNPGREDRADEAGSSRYGDPVGARDWSADGSGESRTSR